MLHQVNRVFEREVVFEKYEDHEAERITVTDPVQDFNEALNIYEELKALNPHKIHILKLYFSRVQRSPPSSAAAVKSPTVDGSAALVVTPPLRESDFSEAVSSPSSSASMYATE